MHLSELDSHDTEICMRLADEPERFHGAVIPPLYGNSLFVYPDAESLAEAVLNEQDHYVYWRGTNPTVEIAEKKLAALERGEQCKCFASGMAAIAAALLNSLQTGDHVLCVSNIYYSTMKILKYLQKFGVEHSVVYSTALEDIEQAIQPATKVIFLESPTSETFRVVDLQAVSKLAKANGIRTIIDNTWATPLFQKPLTLGIDMVVHSASKYLGGHSDLVGGALITNRDTIRQVFTNEYLSFGGVMAPYEASLLLRGLRTLPMRMRTHQANAMQVAQFLESHPAVSKVNYPGLPSHPDYRVGQKQLTGYSGVLSFELHTPTFEAVKKVINKLKKIRIGVSWGSFESLILPANLGNNADTLRKQHINPGLIRLSVGTEEAAVLMQDLEQALA